MYSGPFRVIFLKKHTLANNNNNDNNNDNNDNNDNNNGFISAFHFHGSVIS